MGNQRNYKHRAKDQQHEQPHGLVDELRPRFLAHRQPQQRKEHAVVEPDGSDHDDGGEGEQQANQRERRVLCGRALHSSARPSNIRLVREPVFNFETRHPGELPHIPGHDGETESETVRGNEQVIGANRCALAGQMLADPAVVTIGGWLEGKNRQRREDHVDTLCEFPGAGFRGAEAKFRGNDDAGADGILTR